MLLRKKIFVIVLTIQVLIVIFLIFGLYFKFTTPQISITPIDKNAITLSPTDKLTYFFEPKAGKTLTEIYYQRVFLPTAPQYTINNDTLNERFDYPIKKEKNTYRIITLGDSFTYGMYMNTADNWPEKLEDRLKTCVKNKKFEVINLAVASYDIQYSVERFKKRGMKYDPDLVIWYLKHDDFAQINEITLPIKNRYYEMMFKNGQLEQSMQRGEYWPHTQKAIKEFEEQYSTEEILKKQLEIMLSLSSYYSGNLLIVLPKIEYQRNKDVVEKFAQKRKNTFLYLDLPDFPRLADLHPNISGHKEIANNVYTYLLNKNLIPCIL